MAQQSQRRRGSLKAALAHITSSPTHATTTSSASTISFSSSLHHPFTAASPPAVDFLTSLASSFSPEATSSSFSPSSPSATAPTFPSYASISTMSSHMHSYSKSLLANKHLTIIADTNESAMKILPISHYDADDELSDVPASASVRTSHLSHRSAPQRTRSKRHIFCTLVSSLEAEEESDSISNSSTEQLYRQCHHLQHLLRHGRVRNLAQLIRRTNMRRDDMKQCIEFMLDSEQIQQRVEYRVEIEHQRCTRGALTQRVGSIRLKRTVYFIDNGEEDESPTLADNDSPLLTNSSPMISSRSTLPPPPPHTFLSPFQHVPPLSRSHITQKSTVVHWLHSDSLSSYRED